MKTVRLLSIAAVLALAATAFSGDGVTALFTAGPGGIPTFRIPALAVTNSGALLAFCEHRWTGISDSGNIDLALRRSTDGGATWSKAKIIQGDGWVTWGNPAPVVDRETGTVWLAFCRNNQRVFIMDSKDDGVTWSEPREITAAVSRPEWKWYATGPGHGIQLAGGRLLIGCDHGEPDIRNIASHVIFSDDHGATWKLGGQLPAKTDECMPVEINGRVYLSMRNRLGQNRRAYAWSEDGGISFSELRTDGALIDSTCQASIASYPGGLTLFLNPASTTRENLSLRASRDGAATWGPARTINAGPSAYSDLAVLPDGSVVLLFENGEPLPYSRISAVKLSRETIAGLAGK